jgi:ankyrin repeat protein
MFLELVRLGELKRAQRELLRAPEIVEVDFEAACAVGHADAVREHLRRDPRLVDSNQEGWTPLAWATLSPFYRVNGRFEAGLRETQKILRDAGVNPNADISRMAALSCSPLDRALELLVETDSVYKEVIRKRMRLMMEGSKRGQRGQRGWRGLPPFYMTDPVSKKYATEMAELSLERGIDPNLAADPDGNTFLHCIALWGNTDDFTESGEWLMARGADPNIRRKDGQTPFVMAIRTGNTRLADAMRAHGARQDSVQPLDELAGACRTCDTRTAHDLLHRHPGILNSMQPEDFQVLVDAAAENRLEQVRFMTQLGIDLGGFGESGCTALHAASWEGHTDVIQHLVEFHAPLNVGDLIFKESPQQWASLGLEDRRSA